MGDHWTGRRWHWGKAGRVRYCWWWFVSIASSGIIAIAASYIPLALNVGVPWSAIPSLGIGQPQTNFDLRHGSTPILNTFLNANIAQIIVSYVYLTPDDILTTVLAMTEWTDYTRGPAESLGVTKPIKDSGQRSTSFLSLPLRWAIPGALTFTLLHWLFFEFFLSTRVEVYNPNDSVNTEDSVTTIYFFPLAILLAVGAGSALLLVVIGLAVCKRYSSAPLARCCSASISAACQSRGGKGAFEEGLEVRRLRWGVIDVPRGDAGVGHATFSDSHVRTLL